MLRNKLTILCLFIGLYVNAQNIVSQQFFQGFTMPSLAATWGKIAWLDTTSMYYAHHEMDSLNNITTQIHNNLLLPDTDLSTYCGFTGHFCTNTIYDNNQELWGIFFDFNLYNDSLSNIFYRGNGCFFLYNFNSNQRYNFYFQNVPDVYITPLEIYKSKMLMHNDTMVVYLSIQSVNPFQFPGYLAINKFINGNMIASSGLQANAPFYFTSYIDEQNKENICISDGNYQSTVQTDLINYSASPVNIFDISKVACAYENDLNNNLLTYYSRPTGDSIHVTTPSTFYDIAVSGFANNNNSIYNSGVALCVDQGNHFWVFKNYTLLEYDGIAWNSYTHNMNPLTSALIPDWKERVFKEYAQHKFVIGNYDFARRDTVGNGFYVFTVNPLVSSVSQVMEVKPYAFYNTNAKQLQIQKPELVKQVSLFDMQGKTLWIKQSAQIDGTMNIPELAAGAYLIQIEMYEGSRQQLKFVVD